MASLTKTIHVNEAWIKLETWLAANATSESTQLPPGATSGEIEVAEAAMGLNFSKDLRTSLLRHNGTGRSCLFPVGLNATLCPLLSLPAIASRWRMWCECLKNGYIDAPEFEAKPKGPILRTWFSPKWIPILSDDSGNELMVDMGPTKGGTPGQVIDFDRVKGPGTVLAEGFGEWFVNAVKMLRSRPNASNNDTGAIEKPETELQNAEISEPECQ